MPRAVVTRVQINMDLSPSTLNIRYMKHELESVFNGLWFLLSSWSRAMFWTSPTFMSRLPDEKLLSEALLNWSSSPTLSQDTARTLWWLLPSLIENVQFNPGGVILLDMGGKWHVAFMSTDFWQFNVHGSITLVKVAFKSGSDNFW
jgi:hypothetical protein